MIIIDQYDPDEYIQFNTFAAVEQTLRSETDTPKEIKV